MLQSMLGLVLATGAGACAQDTASTLPPIGQLLLYVNTDAPLAPALGETPLATDPPALFDRVRVDVFRPGEATPCEGCTHEFEIDRALVGGGRASVGITTPPGRAGFVARVRMFRAAFEELGEPRVDATLDTTVRLPPTEREGITPVTVVLHTEDVGRPIGSVGSPMQPELGAAKPGLVGTWPGAARVPCKGAPEPGEVCVPGGAFWMGNPLLRGFHDIGDSVVMRLTVVSPFFLDATEVTVGAFRASGVFTKGDPLEFDGFAATGRCTYTVNPEATDALPVSCISWDKARAFCNARGADLPSEAQHQYAASGLSGKVYVWGDDTPACGDAVYARSTTIFKELKCPGGWLEVPAAGARDRLVLPGGVIFDLAGNLAEHALDVWNLQSEPCWNRGGVFRDPLCDEPGERPTGRVAHTIVGGAWTTFGATLAAAARTMAPPHPVTGTKNSTADTLAVSGIGFRCARKGR